MCIRVCGVILNDCLCSRWRRVRMSGQSLTVSPSTLPRGPSWWLPGDSPSTFHNKTHSSLGSRLHILSNFFSSKVEMTKWIEDLNMAIDIAKKSQEKSEIFLDPSLCDRSNSEDSFFFFKSLHFTTLLELDIKPIPPCCSLHVITSPCSFSLHSSSTSFFLSLYFFFPFL